MTKTWRKLREESNWLYMLCREGVRDEDALGLKDGGLDRWMSGKWTGSHGRKKECEGMKELDLFCASFSTFAKS